MDGLTLAEYSEHSKLNENTVSDMLELAKNYNKVRFLEFKTGFKININRMDVHCDCSLFQALEDEEKMTPEQLAIKNVGKQDPKRHLEEKVDTLMSTNIVQCLGAMLDTVVFK